MTTYDVSGGIYDLIRERVYQECVKGWTAEKDAQWTNNELVNGAISYAFAGVGDGVGTKAYYPLSWEKLGPPPVRDPTNPSRTQRALLIKAAALLLAEVDRLDRSADTNRAA